ncbi:MAG: iron-sulfur cluster assembly accessory protein [Candidatus Poribacteria bacterium]|nr:iron-sulfur cluster assembly accessory protein [Candidatus Poribacteria bacterium]
MKNIFKKNASSESSLLVVTETAQEKIQNVIEAEDVEVEGLRISIEGRSASAFQYSLGLATEAEEGDIVLDMGTFKVLVDSNSADDLKGAVIDYVEDLNSSGFKIDNPNTPTWDNPKAQKIQELIDERINPAVAAHGGQIDLLNVEDDAIYIHMGGGCQGCGMANATLKHGIEAMIQEVFPEIKQVIDTTDHASGTNPYYSSGKG